MIKWKLYKTVGGLIQSQQDFESYMDLENFIENIQIQPGIYWIGDLKVTNVDEFLYCLEYGKQK